MHTCWKLEQCFRPVSEENTNTSQTHNIATDDDEHTEISHVKRKESDLKHSMKNSCEHCMVDPGDK